MKKNRILSMISAAVLLTAGACSDDTLNQGNAGQGLLGTDDTSGGVYMTVDFKMPAGGNGTRSITLDPDDPNYPEDNDNPNGYVSSGGEEVGSAEENYVSSALIILAAKDAKPDAQIKKYGFIVAGEVPSNRITTTTGPEPGGGKQYKATARLQKENFNTLYTTYAGGPIPDVYVFVFANPTTELLAMFDGANTAFGSDSWIDATCEVLQSTDASQSKNVGIWGSNSFLMNNVELTTRGLPQNILDWETFSSVENPFHLSGLNDRISPVVDNQYKEGNPDSGAVKIERSVARFDFKDGSTEGDNRYNVLKNTNADGDFDNAKPIVDVQIQKMCLVNMCNKFYYLPRVSPDGQSKGYTFGEDGYLLCGAEKYWTREANGDYTGGNYVVGPYAEFFGGYAIMTDFSTYFNFPFFENNGSFNNEAMSSTRWDVVKVENVLNNTPDNYTGVDGTQAPGQYHVWRYVTENVIPSNNKKQLNGISTGVVFKGKLLGSKLADTENPGYYEEDWNKGHIKNLANCLNGKPFTYNGQTITLNGKSDHDPILYYFDGHLYMGWRHIRQAAIQASVTLNAAGNIEINRSTGLFKAVFGDDTEAPIPTYTDETGEHNMVYIAPDGTSHKIEDPMWAAAEANHTGTGYQAYLKSANYAWSQWALNGKEVGDDATGGNSSEKLTAMRLAVTGAGITIFQSSDDGAEPKGYGPGYYCYYYYWNRHNDNGLNGSMGPMEFDVVRNNVYKLSIDKISRLGHPRIPENDPDNPTPDTPDESDEIYLDVRVQIVPWVVRLNSIQF